MAYYHRIDTSEIDTQITTPVEGTAGLQVVIGTAPVNMADDPYSVTNVPVLAYSYTEAVSQLGYSSDFKSYTLCQSMYMSFQIFGVAPVIFINVLDPAKHVADYTEAGLTIESKKATIEKEGILPDTLVVSDQDGSELTVDVDYVATFNSSGGIDITLLTTDATAAATSLSVSAKALDPTAVTEDDIIGGYDSATGAETGLEVIRQVYPKLGLTPGIIIAPGWSKDPGVGAVMATKTTEVNGVFTCETAIDIDTETYTVYTQMKTAKEEIAITNEHAILLWPKLRLSNGYVVDYSAAWAAMTAYTDANNDDVPMKSPSNELLNVSAAVLEDGTEVLLDTVHAELVNSYGIVTAINSNGWKAWGNNTAAYPNDTDPKNRWIACRRMMSWYRNHFILTYAEKVDDPMNPRLIEAVVDAENIYLNSLTQAEKIAGGSIEYDEAENTIESILDGNLIFHTKIAFWIPAEYILNKIEFDPTILETALGGE